MSHTVEQTAPDDALRREVAPASDIQTSSDTVEGTTDAAWRREVALASDIQTSSDTVEGTTDAAWRREVALASGIPKSSETGEGTTDAALRREVALASDIPKSSETGEGTADLAWQWRYDGEGRLVEIIGPGTTAARISYGDANTDGVSTKTTVVHFGDERRTFVRVFVWTASASSIIGKVNRGEQTLQH